MVEIHETQAGFEVHTTTYTETFVSKFKAIMAAHAVAMKEAVQRGQPVRVMVPMGWGRSDHHSTELIFRPLLAFQIKLRLADHKNLSCDQFQ